MKQKRLCLTVGLTKKKVSRAKWRAQVRRAVSLRAELVGATCKRGRACARVD